MSKFRKKAVVIEAFQMTEERRGNNADWPQWLNQAWNMDRNEEGSLSPTSLKSDGTDKLQVFTLEGTVTVDWGDFIIKGTQGEIYPCKPDIFHEVYDEETDDAPVGKSYQNSDADDATKNVPDITFFGNGDAWRLLSKASSKKEKWMKSTKAMEIPERWRFQSEGALFR